MENEQQMMGEKKEFFGSKTNGILLLVLILLMIIAIVIMLGDKQKYFGAREDVVGGMVPNQENTSEQNKNEIINSFLPQNTNIEKSFEADLNNDGKNEIIFSYTMKPTSSELIDTQGWNSGIIVIDVSGEKPLLVSNREYITGNGSGVWSAPDINLIKDEEVKGKNAIAVIFGVSGAGVATFWELLVYGDNGTMNSLSPQDIQEKAFADMNYAGNMGYNGASVKNNTIIETGSGYSKEASRCCPDRDPWQMIFSYTAGKLKLENVSILSKTE